MLTKLVIIINNFIYVKIVQNYAWINGGYEITCVCAAKAVAEKQIFY